LGLLDDVLPRWDVAKTYRLAVDASPEMTFSAALRHDFREAAVARFLMRLRGYGELVARPRESSGLVASLKRLGFVFLGEIPDRELVFGLVGRFWTPGGDLRAVSAVEFAEFQQEGFAKAAWNVAVTPEANDRCVLSTETRVICFGGRARWRFRTYWSLIEPFSGWIRKELLRGIRRRAEGGSR
jgi:hypothetical protein